MTKTEIYVYEHASLKVVQVQVKGHLAKLHSLEASYFQLAAQYAWNLFSYQISFPNKMLVQKLDVFSCICMFYLHFFFTLHGWGRGGDVDSIIDMSCPTFWKEHEWKKSDIWGYTKNFLMNTYHTCASFLLGAFTLLTSRFLKLRHFDPTIYICAKKSRSFSFMKLRDDFLLGSAHVRSLATVHACMQRMQYAWGPRISINVSKSGRS